MNDAARQRAYAKVRGDREVYTPQIVVNGATHVLGSDPGAIERAITVTDRNTTIMSAQVLLSLSGNALNVNITAPKDHGGGEVWLCPLTRSVPVEIGRGENHGRTVTYHNVVRHRLKVGDWTGAAVDLRIPTTDFVDGRVDRVAVILQAGTLDNPGPVLGAAIEPVKLVQTNSAR